MEPKSAELYRVVTDQHVCPFGLKARDLLQREGYAVDDHKLTSRAETDAFTAQYHVKTTPQAFIDRKRIGGYDDLRRHFGKSVSDPQAVSYRPAIAVSGMAALMALAANWETSHHLFTVRAAEWFIAFSMCILALLKLRDTKRFSNVFLGYDLLAQRIVFHACMEPLAEALP